MSVILATAGYDKKIRFWEAPSGICSRTLRYPDSQVNCLEITPDKQFLAAGGNPHIRLYEIPSSSSNSNSNSSNASNNNLPPSHPTNPPSSSSSNPNNINDPSSQPVLQCEGHTSSVTSIGFQRDGRWMYSCSEDHTIKIWDLRSSTYSHSFDCQAPVNSVALHPNQTQILSGDQNGSIQMWDIRHSSSSSSLNPSSTSIKTNKPIKVLTPAQNGDSKNQDQTMVGIKPSIQSVDISEDGRLAMAATHHANVYLWDIKDMSHWKPLRKFRAHPHGAYLLKAKISPDGRHLVTTSSDKTAKLWSTQQLTKLYPNPNAPSLLQLRPPQVTKLLGQHQRWVWDAVFSADSSYLVTACSDHWARLWNLQTGEVVRQYTGHRSAVTCVALNDSST